MAAISLEAQELQCGKASIVAILCNQDLVGILYLTQKVCSRPLKKGLDLGMQRLEVINTIRIHALSRCNKGNTWQIIIFMP